MARAGDHQRECGRGSSCRILQAISGESDRTDATRGDGWRASRCNTLQSMAGPAASRCNTRQSMAGPTLAAKLPPSENARSILPGDCQERCAGALGGFRCTLWMATWRAPQDHGGQESAEGELLEHVADLRLSHEIRPQRRAHPVGQGLARTGFCTAAAACRFSGGCSENVRRGKVTAFISCVDLHRGGAVKRSRFCFRYHCAWLRLSDGNR
jgi:hypothetical protein